MFQLVIDRGMATPGNGLACVSDAQKKAIIREYARDGGFSPDRVWHRCPTFDPTTAE